MYREFNIRFLHPREISLLDAEMRKTGVDQRGREILREKGEFLWVRLDNLPLPGANILKQEVLAKGGDVAVPKEACTGAANEFGSCIIIATKAQIFAALPRLFEQPFRLAHVADSLYELLTGNFTLEKITVKGRDFNWGKRTYIMGIINITPDSFSRDGLWREEGGPGEAIRKALEQADVFLKEGADILDVGGESTRPGAQAVDADTELKRVVPVIKALAQNSPLPISIDTYKSKVAKEAVLAGADIINDIWGGMMDPEILDVALEAGTPYIIMHNRDHREYQDLLGEIIGDLRARLEAALNKGVDPGRLIMDPGIGFGKTREHNLEIIKRLRELRILGCPILVGTSRKSVVGLTLDLPVEERLEGTAATVCMAIMNGADIIRVHDVKAMARVARMTDAVARGW
ncbi:MAG: dihydropteroate synthase [Bacillota bacterium]